MSALEYQFAMAGDMGWMLTLTVAILLLIACANVANLLMARAEARRSGIAVRLATGCGRPRLIRQLLTESFLLAFLGAAAELLLAAWLIRLLPALVPGAHMLFRLDHRVLLFTLGATALTGVLFGLLPALRAFAPREIGIRMALGARQGDALALILRRALGLAASGAAIGIAGALAASRWLSSLAVGVSPRDPATLAGACALLIAIALAAAVPPARRASRVDPSVALHYE
jgi:putative ABC transport system permease protein